MKHSLLTSLTLIAAAGLAQAAAAPASAFTTTGNLSFNSDYVFRGVSQTAGKFALQGGYDVSHTSGLSAGVWASNVDFAPATTELDAYAAYGFAITKELAASIGVIRYHYAGKDASVFNTTEVNAGATISNINLKVSYNLEDYAGAPKSKGTLYTELNYSYDIAAIQGLATQLHYGWTSGRGAVASYDDLKVGLTYPVLGYSLGVAYTVSNKAGRVALGDVLAGSAYTVSLGKTF